MQADPKGLKPWQFWIDRGGTFTDIVAITPDGRILSDKLLSQDTKHYEDAAIEGIHRFILSECEADVSHPMVVKMGTTVATNALLERQGEPTLLLISKGFADALRIGYQNRPDLFSLKIQRPEMLYQQVIEVAERIDADGNVLEPLDASALHCELKACFDTGIRSIAIVLMHGYCYPQHELQIAERAKQIGFTQISLSHQASPLIKLVARGDTTVVDAYLSPILKRYVNHIECALRQLHDGDHCLQFMQSSGGLTEAHQFAGKDAVLSGPAGGVVGMVETAGAAGFDQLIGFDMGGTSTDVCHFAGEYERSFETEVAGVRMRAPMMRIHTIAAGGGSILHYDGARFSVGPDSAGADPGPACYRKGGPLCVTDCNVLLGRIQPEYFPRVFGPDADQWIDLQAVQQKFNQLTREVNQSGNRQLTPEQVASGFLEIAIENMANAIKNISVQRGYDISDYCLCCFGGAGAQHACAVADALNMQKIFLHPYAGVLSAFGIGLADARQIRERSVARELTATLLSELQAVIDELVEQASSSLLQQGEAASSIRHEVRLHCHYQGSDTVLNIAWDDADAVRQAFDQQHQRSFGFFSAEKKLMLQSLEVECIAHHQPPELSFPKSNSEDLLALNYHPVIFSNKKYQTAFYQRQDLPVDMPVYGPAVILEPTSTILIDPGWQGRLTSRGDLLLERYLDKQQDFACGTEVDPVMLEIFNNLFMSIAEQMGAVLQNTSVSVNIKERLDFSCAVFDAQGDLIANAPHMPVHLGSMSESIKAVIHRHQGKMQPGDAYILNAPYNGGTHLPDITMIKPVFVDNHHDQATYKVEVFVAARGHHADIGGITPGSMPSSSTHVDEEGVLFDCEQIVSQGEFLEDKIRQQLISGPYPARNPQLNIADFKAQLAACEKGMQELLAMVKHYGLAVVQAYMQHVQHNAEESVRRVLEVLSDGEFSYPMDDGSTIRVAITVDKKTRSACIDFTGSSAQHPGNFNAPASIARAAVLYVFRALVDAPIPLNQGCLKPLQIVLPQNSLVNPQYPAAVVAGNVETSQAIVDCLLAALEVCAASQGTMNNVTWGNDRYQYYETLCGGEGASEGHHGQSAIHTHMTNSRLTDPEVLESRFPVLLESFSIRTDSAGKGRFNGGEGVERIVRFNESMQLSLLTGHRKIPPFGLKGGEPGKPGENRLERVQGETELLASTAQVDVQPGDKLIIRTPGGGGYGKQS